MFQYDPFAPNRLRVEEVAKVAAALEPEDWTRPRPTLFHRKLAALSPAKRVPKPAKRHSAAEPSLATNDRK